MLKFLLPALLTATALAQDYYNAALDGAQEVPPVATAARGWAVVRHDPTSNVVRIFVYHESPATPPTAAHLHQGVTGSNGGVIFALTPAAPNAYTGTTTLTPAQAVALASSGTYINVHTAPNPGGEIRGQVVPATRTRFTGVLSGGQEVPPIPSAGSGTVVAFLDQPENRMVYVVETAGLGNVTAAHIHRNFAGLNGPVIVALNGIGSSFCGVTDRLSATDLTALLANGVYCNVHTAAFPGGELRAQLIKDVGDHFVATLDGAQPVPATGSPGLGGASMVLDASGTLTLTGAFGGLIGATTVAHVHSAPAGSSGGVVFPLAIGAGTLNGSFVPSTAQLADMRAGNWYVNLHSTSNPSGEIRGQLTAAKLPTTFGSGCVGSNGTRPQIGATGVAAIGAGFSVDLYGALPAAITLFSFGSNRDAFAGAVPLPLELTLAGVNSPNCFVLVDPNVLLVGFSNALGCSRQVINVPFVPVLRGSRHHTQWLVLDGAANPGGFVASSALTFTIQ